MIASIRSRRSVDDAKGRRLTRATVRWLARLGYGARGVIYVLFGALALHTAVTLSGTYSMRGTLSVVHDAPGGMAFVLATAAGMAAYAVWRFVQAGFDTDGHGWGLRALTVRGALLVSAAAYGSLAWACLKLATASLNRRSQPVQHYVSATLSWPFGREVVVLAGVVVIGAGIAHLYKAWCAGFRRWFEASPTAMLWIDPVSRIGLCARGLLFVGVGGFVVYSGVTLQPREALGVAQLFDWVRSASYGRWLLAAWAVGVMLFGAYSLIEAFVRRVDARPNKGPSDH